MTDRTLSGQELFELNDFRPPLDESETQSIRKIVQNDFYSSSSNSTPDHFTWENQEKSLKAHLLLPGFQNTIKSFKPSNATRSSGWCCG